jgi:hypothetical protein
MYIIAICATVIIEYNRNRNNPCIHPVVGVLQGHNTGVKNIEYPSVSCNTDPTIQHHSYRQLMKGMT